MFQSTFANPLLSGASVGVAGKKLIEVLETLIAPIRERRKHYEARPDDVIDALRSGTKRANAVAEETLAMAKAAMKQDYFKRELTLT